MGTTQLTISPRAAWRLSLSAAAIALASMALTIAHAQTPSAPPAGATPAMHGGMGWGGGGWGYGAGMHEHMLDLAGASADQKAKVREIFTAARNDMRAQLQAGRAMQAQMAQLLLAPTLDATAVDVQRQKLMALHETASQRMTRAMLDASAVLTPDQRAKLGQAIQQRSQMMERHRLERQSLEAPGS